MTIYYLAIAIENIHSIPCIVWKNYLCIYETLTKVYNCSEFSGNVDGLSATYNDRSDDSVTGNFAPYCQELYNARDIPYGFRHKALPGYDAGTSLKIPIESCSPLGVQFVHHYLCISQRPVRNSSPSRCNTDLYTDFYYKY